MHNGASTSSGQLEQVLALDGAEFLGRAYVAMLGRPVDPEGFRNYEAKLRSGVSKRAILAELASSTEGQTYRANATGDIPALNGSSGVQPTGGKADHAQTESHLVAADLGGLLALDDLEFVNCAYRTLLGREPDPSGREYYLRILRSGAAKMRLVSKLCSSPEGRRAGANLPGLRAATWRYRLAAIPVIGWCYRRFRQVEGNSPIECRLRAIENALSRLVREQERETEELDAAADKVSRALRGLL
jgi:hypothetical protein